MAPGAGRRATISQIKVPERKSAGKESDEKALQHVEPIERAPMEITEVIYINNLYPNRL